MATAKAYGSITIVDISDLGTLSVYPESNQPYSVIYDPNINNGTYSPDWSENNLILSPVVYYGSENIKLTDPNLTVTWTKKIGSNDTSLGGTENVSGKKLIVSSNVLNSNNAIVTYICSIIYTEPQSGTQLKAEGRISFSLIVQPTTIKSCKITGETVFLYNSSQELVSTSPIVLNAKLDNCSITKWAYKNSSGTWTDISSTSTTLSIPANSPYFNGDIATIKIVTDVPELEDIHVISKIRDGAPGDSTVVAILSNEDQMIAFDKNGNPAGGQAAAYADAHTTITVYDGNTDVTADATITPVAGSAITGSWNSTTYTYTVTKITGNGNVQFTIVYGGRTISKTFLLLKFKLARMAPML